MKKFLTVRETVRELGLPEHMLRTMIKRNECPGFYNGNRFMVDARSLENHLHVISSRNTSVAEWYKPNYDVR